MHHRDILKEIRATVFVELLHIPTFSPTGKVQFFGDSFQSSRALNYTELEAVAARFEASFPVSYQALTISSTRKHFLTSRWSLYSSLSVLISLDPGLRVKFSEQTSPCVSYTEVKYKCKYTIQVNVQWTRKLQVGGLE